MARVRGGTQRGSIGPSPTVSYESSVTRSPFPRPAVASRSADLSPVTETISRFKMSPIDLEDSGTLLAREPLKCLPSHETSKREYEACAGATTSPTGVCAGSRPESTPGAKPRFMSKTLGFCGADASDRESGTTRSARESDPARKSGPLVPSFQDEPQSFPAWASVTGSELTKIPR